MEQHVWKKLGTAFAINILELFNYKSVPAWVCVCVWGGEGVGRCVWDGVCVMCVGCV